MTNHAPKGLESAKPLPASAPMQYFVLSILSRQHLLRRSRSNHESTPEAESWIMRKVSQAKGARAPSQPIQGDLFRGALDSRFPCLYRASQNSSEPQGDLFRGSLGPFPQATF